MAQDKDRWRAVVDTVMNIWILSPRSESVKRNMVAVRNIGHIYPMVLQC
jgi:hypothetical protein